MFDIGSSELLLIIVVAVVVIGPKDLPRALYKLGQIIGKGRAMTRHFRAGLDAMVREAELEELQKKWAADNARIMAEHPQGTEALTEAPEPDGLAGKQAQQQEQGAAGDTPALMTGHAPDGEVGQLPEERAGPSDRQGTV